jgi:hypothetical protein
MEVSMNYLIGIGVLLILIAIIIFEICIVRAIKDIPVKEEPKVIEKPKEEKLTDEQKKKQEKLRKSFDNLMGYGYEQALKPKGE